MLERICAWIAPRFAACRAVRAGLIDGYAGLLARSDDPYYQDALLLGMGRRHPG